MLLPCEPCVCACVCVRPARGHHPRTQLRVHALQGADTGEAPGSPTARVCPPRACATAWGGRGRSHHGDPCWGRERLLGRWDSRRVRPRMFRRNFCASDGGSGQGSQAAAAAWTDAWFRLRPGGGCASVCVRTTGSVSADGAGTEGRVTEWTSLLRDPEVRPQRARRTCSVFQARGRPSARGASDAGRCRGPSGVPLMRKDWNVTAGASPAAWCSPKGASCKRHPAAGSDLGDMHTLSLAVTVSLTRSPGREPLIAWGLRCKTERQRWRETDMETQRDRDSVPRGGRGDAVRTGPSWGAWDVERGT